MNWLRRTFRLLVWLLAALVPIQGYSGVSCGCMLPPMQTAESEQGHQRPGCCDGCAEPARPDANPSAAAQTCCRQADPQQHQGCCCGCGTECKCQQEDSVPTPKHLPPERRSATSDQAVATPVFFGLAGNGAEAAEGETRTGVAVSALDRCVVLCRFHL